MKYPDKVVCVEGGPRDPYPHPDHPQWEVPAGFPVEGQLYVVSGMFDYRSRWPDCQLTESYLIVGLPNIWYGGDIGWDPARFRYLEEMQSQACETEHATA